MKKLILIVFLFCILTNVTLFLYFQYAVQQQKEEILTAVSAYLANQVGSRNESQDIFFGELFEPRNELFEDIEKHMKDTFSPKNNQQNQITKQTIKFSNTTTINGESVHYTIDITNDTMYGLVTANSITTLTSIKEQLEILGASVIASTPTSIEFEAEGEVIDTALEIFHLKIK